MTRNTTIAVVIALYRRGDVIPLRELVSGGTTNRDMLDDLEAFEEDRTLHQAVWIALGGAAMVEDGGCITVYGMDESRTAQCDTLKAIFDRLRDTAGDRPFHVIWLLPKDLCDIPSQLPGAVLPN